MTIFPSKKASPKDYSNKDKIEIEFLGNNFILQKSDITDIRLKNETEIVYDDSIKFTESIKGYIAFGSLGGTIGGMKPNKKRKQNFFLIISYNSDDFINSIYFDVSQSIFIANKFVNDFKALNKNKPIHTIKL